MCIDVCPITASQTLMHGHRLLPCKHAITCLNWARTGSVPVQLRYVMACLLGTLPRLGQAKIAIFFIISYIRSLSKHFEMLIAILSIQVCHVKVKEITQIRRWKLTITNVLIIAMKERYIFLHIRSIAYRYRFYVFWIIAYQHKQ